MFDQFFFPGYATPRVYVVSDSQMAEYKLKAKQEELEQVAAQRSSLEQAYQARVKVLDDRVSALDAEVKALAPAEVTACTEDGCSN